MEQLLRLAEEHGISPGMSKRTTCSVVAHELAHAILGHLPSSDATTRARQERRADEWAARLLITPAAYAEAERARGPYPTSIAFELGVTVELVIAYQRLLCRMGDDTYVDPRMGRGQWAYRTHAD
jgi:Zn-dependent peptidase ImmA (M78 family)